ncbi:hypothetical protein D3C76_1033330 [compost metagenome]
MGGVGWEMRKWITSSLLPRLMRTGTSAWFLEESGNCAQAASSYQGSPHWRPAGIGALGLLQSSMTGFVSPGISFHLKCWKVRIPLVSMGYFDIRAKAYWPW